MLYAESTQSKKPVTLDTLKEGIHLREVWGHKEAITALSLSQHCGLISCSKAGYDVRVWDPKTLDLLLVFD